MRRNLHASYFGQGGDLARFRQSSDVGRRQIENRRRTLIDQTGKVFQTLKVFSCSNGNRGGTCHFGHFIHATGWWHRLFHPEKVKLFKPFAGRDSPFGRALAVAAGALDPSHRPDLTNTAPVTPIGPHRQWSEPHRIVSLDPYGHLITECFQQELRDGLDIRPSIAVTRARLSLPELMHANTSGLAPDGRIKRAGGHGQCSVN